MDSSAGHGPIAGKKNHYLEYQSTKQSTLATIMLIMIHTPIPIPIPKPDLAASPGTVCPFVVTPDPTGFTSDPSGVVVVVDVAESDVCDDDDARVGNFFPATMGGASEVFSSSFTSVAVALLSVVSSAILGVVAVAAAAITNVPPCVTVAAAVASSSIEYDTLALLVFSEMPLLAVVVAIIPILSPLMAVASGSVEPSWEEGEGIGNGP